MEIVTRFYCEHVRVQNVYVRSSILRACMENQYQTFIPERYFPEFIFQRLETTGESFCCVGVKIFPRKP